MLSRLVLNGPPGLNRGKPALGRVAHRQDDLLDSGAARLSWAEGGYDKLIDEWGIEWWKPKEGRILL